jgi:PAS domain S-box-containing protein
VSNRTKNHRPDAGPSALAAWLAAALAGLALVPGIVGRGRWKERPRRRRASAETPPVTDAPPAAPPVTEDEFVSTEQVHRVRASLAGALRPTEAADRLFEAVRSLPGADVVLLALVDEDQRRVSGFLARGADEAWWRGVSVDLEHDSGGMATAVNDRTAFAVYDAGSAPKVNRRLAESVDAKSIAFVPLMFDEPVGVLVVASVAARRFFSSAELEVLQELANAVAPMLARSRSADALERALGREKLVSDISRKVRSELDLDTVLDVAVTETAAALAVSRCIIRLVDPAGPAPIAGQWTAPGLEPITAAAEQLAVSNLALREGRTVAIGDIATATELDEGDLGGRDLHLRLGSHSALATPIVVFDQTIGTFSLHRDFRGAWPPGDIAVAEAVAGEIGIAIHAARLISEDERRLGLQSALLNAAQVVTSDLRFDSVVRRLVDEVAALFEADAADCWIVEPESTLIRCRAVHGLPEEEELGRRIEPGGAQRVAMQTGEPVLARDFAGTETPAPSKNFADFKEVMVAPMTWLGEVRGVLGVLSYESGRFDSSELEILDAFARFASLAFNNAESYEERERQARIQQGFYRVAEALGSPLSLAETLDALAQAAAEALGGDSAAVLEPGGPGLRLAGSHELPPSIAERFAEGLPAGATPFRADGGEERIVTSSGLESDERFDPEIRSLLERGGYRTLICAPVSRGRERSVVVVLFRAQRTFSEDDLALARHLSRAARGALERSELFEGERRERGRSQRLASAAAELTRNLAPERVLDEVVAQARTLLDADAAVVRLLEGEELVVRAAAGTGGASLVGTRSGSAAGLSGEVAQSRRARAFETIADEPGLVRGDALLGAGMAAAAAVPLIGHGGGVRGVLSAYSRESRAWRPDDVQALAALAALAAAALGNAELYRDVAEEKERSEAILANIADGIVATDREGRIVLWNATAAEITGVPAAEAVGRRVPETLQRELATEDGAAAGERQVSILRGGKEVWLSLTEAVMRDSEGGVAGRIFAFRDVSVERAVEQMKSEFVATVSHELRTPLTSIYGFAETLQRPDIVFGDTERDTFLAYIVSESERLIHIVDDLLNVARLEAGTLDLALGPTDVGEVVGQAVARLGEGDSDTSIVVDVPEGLVAEADGARLVEVVHQLVDNAVKFSPEGGTVTVTGRRTSDAVEVSVEDEGAGISPADRPRIFTKFFRSGEGRVAVEGTGVGLFLARGLLAAMHGRIWLEPTEGHGSRFVFELPVSNGVRAGTEERVG